MTLVFVYGTLKRGEALHAVLSREDRSEFCGHALLRDFALYDLGAFPGIVPQKGGRVFGEVYKVTAETLAALDRIEGTPVLYRREEVSVSWSLDHLASRGISDIVETYIYNGWPKGNRIVSGIWPTEDT